MALHLGELTIGLQLENDSIRPGIDQAKRELESLPPVAQREVRKISREFDAEGRNAGGKLAQGINQGLIRNSPLIVAAVGGALAAGAPVALAGAATLFGGVAAVALSQNEAVASSYRSLWGEIRTTTIRDAQVLAPAFIQAADQISSRFQVLGPQIRSGFEAAAPQVATFTTGILDLASNAMPGLVRAVERSQPVMDGLASLLADTGTGLTGFFDGMSEHAPAAGQAFESIGDILETLLPTLGSLLGTGAEIASVVLPPLASALHAVEGPLDAIAPILPAVVAGFIGFKAAQGVASIIDKTAGALGSFATQGAAGVQVGGRMGSAMSSTSRALSGVGAALPLIGVGLSALAINMAKQEQLARDNTVAFTDLFTALRSGGAAAAQAREGIATAGAAVSDLSEQGRWGAMAADQLTAGMESGAEAAKNQAEATDVLVSAQQTAEAAQSTLNSAIEDYGAGSPEVAAAAADLANANQDVADKAAAAEQATYGLTTAIAAQLTQALTAASADLAYRDAVDQVQSAQEDLTVAVRDHGAASEEADDAGRQLESSMLAQVEAAGRLATEALPATTDALTVGAVAAQAQLAELEALRATMGGTLPPALEAARASLASTAGSIDQTTVATNIATGEIQNLGLNVTQLPNSKFIKVDAPTAAQQQQMRDLGYEVLTLPDGSVYVTAQTSAAESALDALTRTRYMTIIATTEQGSSSRAASVQQLAASALHKATGGSISGPGSGTSDDVLVAASNGEHMWTAREVQAAGGHGAVEQMRRQVLAGPRGYATGGPITTSPTAPGGTTTLEGLRVTGTFQMDRHGLITLVDGRLATYDETGRRDSEFVNGGF